MTKFYKDRAKIVDFVSTINFGNQSQVFVNSPLPYFLWNNSFNQVSLTVDRFIRFWRVWCSDPVWCGGFTPTAAARHHANDILFEWKALIKLEVNLRHFSSLKWRGNLLPRAEQVKLEERQVCLTDNRYVNVIRQSFAAGGGCEYWKLTQSYVISYKVDFFA